MNKTFKLITISLLFVSIFFLQNCNRNEEQVTPTENEDPVIQSSIIDNKHKTLYSKINTLYNLSSVKTGEGRSLFDKKDLQLNNSTLNITRKGDRIINIPITKHF